MLKAPRIDQEQDRSNQKDFSQLVEEAIAALNPKRSLTVCPVIINQCGKHMHAKIGLFYFKLNNINFKSNNFKNEKKN